MITEAQFTDAMERAVALRGESWRYPSPSEAPAGYYVDVAHPTYADEHGNPTCLIGVVLHLLGAHVPRGVESPSALSVLMGYTENRVALAARCAQVHQDNRRPWGEALAIYRAALTIQETRQYTPFDAMDLYRRAYMKVTGGDVSPRAQSSIEALKELTAAFDKISTSSATIKHTAFSIGGVIDLDSIIPNGSSITFKMPESLTMPTLTTDYFAEKPLVKKDHALIA